MVTYRSIFHIMNVASMDRVVIMTIQIYILESAVLNCQIVKGLHMACHNSGDNRRLNTGFHYFNYML